MAQDKGSIMVVDDDQDMRSMLTDFLRGEGYRVFDFPLATEAFEALYGDFGGERPHDEIDLVLSDINMPAMDGMEFADRIGRFAPEIPVVLVTAYGSIDSAIEATKKGVFDYIVKPLQLSELGVTVERAIKFRRLKRENQVLRNEVNRSWSFGGLIGKSKAIREVFELTNRVARATANVLITGESGTGKEVIARAIHARGPRSAKPFVALNCSSIPENLLESELFGHVKGSFTGAIANKQGLFEEADGGTIFLDEIGDMDITLQAKVLRVLQDRKIKPVGGNQEKEVDVRVLAATHKDLKKAIQEGRFREDLYYRLNVIPVVIPPLRHRRDDIPLLANHFLAKYAAANNSTVKGFSPEAMAKLVGAHWGGNVRELENIIERVVVLCSSEWIRPEDIPLLEEGSAEDFFGSSSGDLPTIEELEKRYIRLVLDKTGGKKEQAAHILGINRRTLYRKEREYGFVDKNAQEEEFSNDETH